MEVWEAVEGSGSEALGTDLSVHGCVQGQGREHEGRGVRQRKFVPLTPPLHIPRCHTQALSLPAGSQEHHTAAHGNPHLPGLCSVGGGCLGLLGAGCPLSSLNPLLQGWCTFSSFSSCCCCCYQQKPLKCHYQALGEGVSFLFFIYLFEDDSLYVLERSTNFS